MLEPEPITLRDHLHAMVHDNPHYPAKAQAEDLNVGYSQLANAVNPTREEDGPHYQLRWLIPHVRLTNDSAVLDYIERAVGRVAVPVVDGAVPEAPDLRRAMLLVAKELGEAAGALEHALQDEQLSARELDRIQRELWETIQAAVAVHVQLEAMREDARA